jgi:N-acetylmuramoyl-L-alanine amidase
LSSRTIVRFAAGLALLMSFAILCQTGLVLAADDRAAATIDPVAYRVSGQVASAAGHGATGTVVHFALDGSEVASALTDAKGYYAVSLSEPGTYAVSCTPSETTGCTFTPVTAAAAVTTVGPTSVNFAARGLRTITGRIPARQIVSPKGITVTCQPWGSSAITDSGGNYSIADVPDGDFTVVPTKKGLGFTPAQTAVSVAGAGVGGVGFHASSLITVVIDAGHQAEADMKTEPVGPGSKTRRVRVAGGTTGVATHRPESLNTLDVALKLRDELVRRGVTVVMVRTTQKVNISNSTRAKIANDAHAALFIRLHCDGSSSSRVRGVLTIVPATNRWTSRIVRKSARAGRDIQTATIRRTHAKNRGIAKRGDLSGFNWSKVPTALIEMGFMTNRAEDRKLASSAYQQKLAVGIADGTVRFLTRK